MAVPEIPDYSLLQQKLGNAESDLMSTSPASKCCVVTAMQEMCLQSTEKCDIPKSGYTTFCRQTVEFLHSAQKFLALANSLQDLPEPEL